MVCISWFPFFHFLYKLIMSLQFFSIFNIWVRDFVCKLRVLLWCLLHSLLMGVYVISYVLESQGTRKTNRTWCFVERKIKKTTLEHPFFFPLLLFLSFLSLHPSLPMPFFFSKTISRKSNFNIQVHLEGQTTINMWRWMMFLIGCCHIHCWFC